MGIAIRETALVNNKIRLSLEIYHQGETKYENLRIFVYSKPKTLLEKDHNKRTRELAESIKAKKVLEMQEGQYNIHTGFRSKGSFIEYYKKLTRERRESSGVHSIWYSACKHLLHFANGRNITFDDCDDRFLTDFRKYLLNVTGRHNKKILNSTAAVYLLTVKTALKQAEHERIILDNPGRRVKGITVHQNTRQFSTIRRD
jgi:hypothetical protein